jgi:hypothetical protein
VEGSISIPQKLFGEVTSPLYPKPYPNNFETTTVITVPKGHRVKLVFWQFDLEPSEGCFYDYVKVGVCLGEQKGDKVGPLQKLRAYALTALDVSTTLTLPQPYRSNAMRAWQWVLETLCEGGHGGKVQPYSQERH